MPEHFTKRTIEASYWCLKCGGPTMHRVDTGRRGPCLACLAKLSSSGPVKKVEPAAQRELFGDGVKRGD
jgi:hypothetical protein